MPLRRNEVEEAVKYPEHDGGQVSRACRGGPGRVPDRQDRATNRSATTKRWQSFTDVTRRVKTDVAAQAQFYIGQIHQVKEDYKAATVAYLRLIALYGQHREWVAAASFESGKCHEALGNTEDARTFYRDVAEKYKDTRWAAAAAERLKGM